MITLIMCVNFLSKFIATVVVLYLGTVAFSESQMQEITTTFVYSKAVATSYATIKPYSNIQCVSKCFEESRNGKCNIAGFNRATKSCQLSDDMEPDVLNTTDEAVGIYIFPQGSYIILKSKVLESYDNYQLRYVVHEP